MKTDRLWTALVVALASLTTLIATAQAKVTVIDTLHCDGVVYELGQTSLEEMDIDMKRDSYVDLVKHAQKVGWDLCPADSASLKRIATKVHLDPDNRKFCAYVATVPFSASEVRWDNAFRIPQIPSRSGEPSWGIYPETIGYFAVDGFKNTFPPIREVTTPGYWRIGEAPVTYDWVFMRPMDITKK